MKSFSPKIVEQTDYAARFVPCRKCAGKGINGKSNGFIYDKDTNISTECQCHISFRSNAHLLDQIKKVGINAAIRYYDIDRDYVGNKSLNAIAKVKFFLKKFKENDSRYHNVMLYMYGPNGCQKTTVGQYIVKEILTTTKSNDGFQPTYYKALYIQMNDLVKEITSFNNKDSESMTDLYARIMQADVLVLDECFDKEKVLIYKSGYQIPNLDSFLRKWMNDDTKSIIFISNVLPTEIEKNGYSYSIQDFISRKVNLDKSLFTFNDNYEAIKETFDTSKGLFELQN